jgi:hypothetical protein
MPDVLSIILNPFGPINTPAIIKPTMPGTFIFLSNRGVIRMMLKMSSSIVIGSFKGIDISLKIVIS